MIKIIFIVVGSLLCGGIIGAVGIMYYIAKGMWG